MYMRNIESHNRFGEASTWKQKIEEYLKLKLRGTIDGGRLITLDL